MKTHDPRPAWRDPLLWKCLGVIIFIAGVHAMIAPALAHDAMPTAAQPNGWTYPLACCSGIDCREVSDEAIIEGPTHYTIAATGEEIPYNSRKVRPSPDGLFHWCSVRGDPDTATICLFVPPRAY